MGLPDPDWKKLGSSDNAEFYLIEEDVLAVLPVDKCLDTEKTARQSIDFQAAHWKQVGHRGGVVVFMDRILEQEAGARAVYANETANHPSTCFALVGETFFGFAVSSAFTGLSRPGIPTQIFRTLEDARPWLAEQTAEAMKAR